MEAPVETDTEDGSDESVTSLPDDSDDEVDINIHFHCEHCIRMYRCHERPKPGWSCEVELCPNRCGQKFHICKLEEHRLMCTHERVPCINAGYGCPLWMQRRLIAEHLPVCPASVVICNAEWNRWALGAKEREKVSMSKGLIALYNTNDLDMSLALRDQELVNEMLTMPKRLRNTLCNRITRRFPALPLTVRGSRHETIDERSGPNKLSRQSTDEEEDGLTPGLSVSVCTELLRGKKQVLSLASEARGSTTSSSSTTTSTTTTSTSSTTTTTTPEHPDLEAAAAAVEGESAESSDAHYAKRQQLQNTDDISAFCCSHGILKNLCYLCKGDPDQPTYKMGKVWRERVSCKKPGEMVWKQEPCVEKVRKRNPRGQFVYMKYDEAEAEEEEEEEGSLDKMIIDDQGRPVGRARFKTPPPVPLTSKALTMELPLKHYSRHQSKPRAMFTFQCMQEIRRCEYGSHYQNCHSEIQEGLDGWILHRCPLHVLGCPYVYNRLHPGRKDGDVIYCRDLRAFGIRPVLEYEPAPCGGLPRSRSPSVEKTTSAFGQLSLLHSHKAMKAIPEHHRTKNCEKQYYASSTNLTYLPIEVLQLIASYLDGFSLNNLSLTCRLMRDVCLSLINDRGLVILEWVRYIEDDKVRWKEGRKRRFFSKSFEHVTHWGFKNVPHMADHLQNCPFNKRYITKNTFAYILPSEGGKLLRKTLRNVTF
ncbi:F-box only protein 30-like isoform X1 [Penaeus indicus]|uniref:F-box only protein 30-like isoform X1 n=1 Tax=Penaeus indicus TaxID=29960 RepID=UPI00300C1E01